MTDPAGSAVRAGRPGRADLVVRGRIATLADEAGFGWASAMAVAGGSVVAVGSDGDVEPLVGPGTRHLVVGPDLVVLPGITDAHLHLADAARAAQEVDLEGAATLEAGVALVAAAAQASPPDAWLQGGGWDPARWGRWPVAADLEAGGVRPDARVALWSHDHHALWVSRRVLTELRMDAATPDPPGGALRRDDAGAPTGILQETAAQVVMERLPRPSEASTAAAIRAFAGQLLALGIVGVHDPGELLADATLGGAFAAVIGLADRGDLPLRVHLSVREPALERAVATLPPTGSPLGADPDSRARMGWLKLFADGALGSRTAWLLEPYEGTADDRGIAVTDPAHLASLARRAAQAGIVTQIHTIGDAALRAAIDALATVAPATGPMARIEHVQMADPSDLPRMAALRIGASVQPIHLRTDVDKARAAWGDRAEARGFLLRSLLAAGVTVAFGTDAPVEPADPWPGIALAVSRTAPEWPDRRPFGPEEAIALDQAIRAATVGPALLAGDPVGGRLVPGSRADFIAVPAASLEPGGPLGSVRPTFVAVDGTIAHES